jgi:hypothetical protein
MAGRVSELVRGRGTFEPTDRLGRVVLLLITLRSKLLGLKLGLRHGERLAAAALAWGGLLGLRRRRLRRRSRQASERQLRGNNECPSSQRNAQGSRTERSPSRRRFLNRRRSASGRGRSPGRGAGGGGWGGGGAGGGGRTGRCAQARLSWMAPRRAGEGFTAWASAVRWQGAGSGPPGGGSSRARMGGRAEGERRRTGAERP